MLLLLCMYLYLYHQIHFFLFSKVFVFPFQNVFVFSDVFFYFKRYLMFPAQDVCHLVCWHFLLPPLQVVNAPPMHYKCHKFWQILFVCCNSTPNSQVTVPENPKANKLAQKCCLLLLEIDAYSISGPSLDEMKCITHTYTIQHNLQLFVHRGNVKGNNGVDEIINMKYWAVTTSLLDLYLHM